MSINLDNITYNEKKILQQKIFNYVDNYFRDHGDFPNFRKISQRFKLSYPQIMYLLEDIECLTYNNNTTQGNIIVEII